MEEYDVLQCVDKGLDLLGSHIRQTIYWRISILHNSAHSCIVENPAVFVKILHELFGDSSYGVEKAIIKELRRVFELERTETVDLEQALLSVRNQITPTVYASY